MLRLVVRKETARLSKDKMQLLKKQFKIFRSFTLAYKSLQFLISTAYNLDTYKER
jgi:hypothetical protein